MYNTKPIDDKDFFKLLELNHELHKLLPMRLSLSAATVALCGNFDKPDKFHIGLYKEDKLVGFISGYGKEDKLFIFDNLYVEKPYRYGTVKLVEFAENSMKELGYTSWYAHSILKQGQNFITKYIERGK